MLTPPRRLFAFRLRTLLIVIAVLSVPLTWVAHSLNWIRQRHAALETGRFVDYDPFGEATAPYGLWIFGEVGMGLLGVPDGPDAVEEAMRLFPEAKRMPIIRPEVESSSR